MKTESKKIVPYRIKQARTSRGMSILELAERLDLTKQSISQYELGRTEPSKSTLNLISATLKYPASFFYKPVLSEKSADSAVFFRSGKTASVKNYNAAKEKIKVFSEINEYLSKFIDFPDVALPEVDYSEHEDAINIEKIEEIAVNLRNYWKLGLGPINNLVGTVEKNGVLVSSMNLGLSRIDGFSIWYNNRPFIFLCADKESNVRIRFSVSHELAHILFHSNLFTDAELKCKDLYNRLEIEANNFAGAFLLPEATFSKDVFSTSIDHFIQLKSKWKASIATMIYRCEALGLLSKNQIKYLKDQMTIRGYWRREPLDDVMLIEKPVAHKQAVDLLFDNGLITSSELKEETGINFDELEDYCFLPKGSLSSTDKSNIVYLRS